MQKLLLSVLLFCACAPQLPAQTLPSVQEVYRIFQNRCISCHDHDSPEANLDLQGVGATELLRAQNVASNLININPTNANALSNGYKRVYPGRADKSFLFKKINIGFEPSVPVLNAQEGGVMPGSFPNPDLTSVEKEIIRQWILFGAKNTGVQFDKTLVENFFTLGGDKSFPNGPPPAPAPGEGFQIKMGPFYLAPDGEVEYYQKWEMNLPADVEVNGLDFKISPFSHHFLLYNFTGSGAATIPAGLRLAANHSQINLVAAVQEATDLRLPGKTAFKWNKNIVLDLNSHYINYSLSQPYQCEAYINIYTQAPGTAPQEMFATLLVNSNIPIPNSGDLVTHTRPEFQFGADSIYIWGLMGHTHKYGRGYKVWKRLINGQKGDLIYDASCPMGVPGCPTPWYDYQHIPIRYWEPSLPIKWSNGIIHEAQWINDGPVPVNFGPTSEDEMMVLIAFYTEQPITVGTDEPGPQLLEKQILVSPNPSNGNVTFTLPEGSEGVRTFRLFNPTGQEVLRRNDLSGQSFDLDLSRLSPGVYFFDADGRRGKLERGL
ncbi:MAG: T9SS type A sorting domain-containing protein [Saprospiraceae bacterium]|nr:T9SS type A sorting domain-containing protein [Saprospiraceae bacterium]